MQITFGQAEIRSADDPRTMRHSSADDLPLIRRRSAIHRRGSAAQVQMVVIFQILRDIAVKITFGNLAKFEVGTFEDDLFRMHLFLYRNATFQLVQNPILFL
ncbi:hypothetical protein B0H13DRAFT_1917873 [Mycena leptocephala]|nr:hypothetical protein B0H13DRAFT_1917873 [Mycena leptocephala]